MTELPPIGRYNEFVKMGNTGRNHDVDSLMHALISGDDLATSKLVDYALSLVNTREGMTRMEHYLFNGEEMQRNYAALYFKRRGAISLIDEAVALGKVDLLQAYAK